MIIKGFHLQAFGPFTETSLEFSGFLPGLHVVYGPNESGKSSTLRALKAWLFGFPERTGDNFLHTNDRLLVSGTLVHSYGEELTFCRRKKRKGSVLDSEGNVLDEALIRGWLQGLDRETFEALFGLDHAGLIQGGTAILQEKGSAGTTLFSAGTGIASVERILNELKEESKDIFKPQGSKPELNTALKRYKELKKEINQVGLSSHAWKEQERALRQAEKDLEKIRSRKKEVQEEEQRLKRLQQALGPLARLREAKAQLDSLGSVPWLPDDFAARRRDNQELLRQAEKTLSMAHKRLAEIQTRKEAIEINTELLDQADTISDLHQRLGAYRKGMHDRRKLEETRLEEQAAAAAIIRRIRPDLEPGQDDVLHDLLSQRREILAHGHKLDVVSKEQRDSAQAVQSIQEELKTKRDELEALPADRDYAALGQAIDEAALLGDVDTALDKHMAQAARDQDAFSAGLRQLGLWQGSPEEILRLPLPLESAVRQFKKEWEALEHEGRNVAHKKAELKKTMDGLHKEMQTQELAGDVPSEEDLKAQRAWREKGWALIRRKWIEGRDVQAEAREYATDLALDQAYEHAVYAADYTADRLRWESSRVHEKARLEAEQELAKGQWEELEETEADLSVKWEELQLRWRQAWAASGIDPAPPEVMSDWQGRVSQWRVTARQIVDNTAAILELQEKRSAARQALEKALADFGKAAPAGQTLAPVLKKAQKTREDIERTAHERITLHKTIRRLERDLEQANKRAYDADQALTAWQKKWGGYMSQLGLPESESPEGVADFFEDLDACLKHLQKAAGYGQRIQGIDQDGQDLTKEVHILLQRVAPELTHLPVDQAVESVKGLLDRAQSNKTTLENYQESIVKTEDEIQAAKADREHARTQLSELCSLAGCREHDELEAVEKKWLWQQELRNKVAAEKASLQEIAPAHSLEDLMAEVEAIDPDSLTVKLQEVAEELSSLEERFEDQSRTVGELKKSFQDMDGRDEAARKAEQAEEVLALIRRQAERFTRLRLAATVLEEAIERYRAENQDPVLALAGEYFREVTMDSFHGLRTDLDDKGEQVIVGLRPDNARVGVEGMSDGTRDQLYLSLRLASLEHRLEKSEPMPFIVDDILVNFDEERARAALKAMARLGEKNQVLVFSHHRQVADAVRELNLGQVHGLG
ncbi:MAG: AAA family ATPase [Desulfovermiculus sp.]|nr:AAA family ATPase [Desulfovermiculus sp.]